MISRIVKMIFKEIVFKKMTLKEAHPKERITLYIKMNLNLTLVILLKYSREGYYDLRNWAIIQYH